MAAQRILVVDDEEDLLEILRFNLEAEGFEVCTATSADQALPLALQQPFDLMLLDVMMEGARFPSHYAGFDLAHALREHGIATPIIFLTALTTDADQLRAFGIGADDYITKPYSFPTLLARIRAVLRRSATTPPTPPQSALPSLTRREYLVWQLLSSHPGHYYTRQEIIDAVWPGDTLVLPRSVDVHIARLRKKLPPAEAARIINRTGFGYAMV